MLTKRQVSKIIFSKWFYRFSAFFLFKFTGIVFIYYIFYYSNASVSLQDHSKPTDFSSIFNTANGDKVILLWTPFYDKWDYQHGNPNQCPVEKSCQVTNDRSKLKESDAIVFHLRDLDLTDLPPYRHPRQRWVLFNLEPPPYSYFLGFRFMNQMFNWTMTYRLDSDIVVKYGGFVSKNLTSTNTSITVVPINLENKTDMAYWMVSHCYTSSRREDFVESLSRVFPVDIYGKCGMATCPKEKTLQCLNNFSNKYFFSFTLENSLCRDYISEKFYEAARYNAIPVVLGGANYALFAPRHSYVDAAAFDSAKELANFLDKLSKSKGFYRSYFDWRKTFELEDRNMYCDLCHKLKTDNVVKVYDDIRKWWVEDSHCRRWSR